MTRITENDIGEILDLLIDDGITDFNPDPNEFQAAIKQIHDRYIRENATVEDIQND